MAPGGGHLKGRQISEPRWPLSATFRPSAAFDRQRKSSKMTWKEGQVSVTGTTDIRSGQGSDPSPDAQFLSKTAIELFCFPSDGDIYKYTAERFRQLAGDSIVMVMSFDERTRAFTCRHVEGMGKLAAMVLKLLGRDPVGMEFSMLAETEPQLRAGTLNRLARGLYSLAREHVPEKACDAIAKVVGLKGIYTIGMASEGALVGMASILRTASADIPHHETVESFARHAATVIRQRETIARLERVVGRYRYLLENSEHLIQVVSSPGRITYVNRAWRRALQYGEDEIYGKNFYDIVQPDNVEDVKKAFLRAAEGKRVEGVEARLLAKDGGGVAVRGYVDCRLVDGKPADTYGVFDVS